MASLWILKASDWSHEWARQIFIQNWKRVPSLQKTVKSLKINKLGGGDKKPKNDKRSACMFNKQIPLVAVTRQLQYSSLGLCEEKGRGRGPLRKDSSRPGLAWKAYQVNRCFIRFHYLEGNTSMAAYLGKSSICSAWMESAPKIPFSSLSGILSSLFLLPLIRSGQWSFSLSLQESFPENFLALLSPPQISVPS